MNATTEQTTATETDPSLPQKVDAALLKIEPDVHVDVLCEALMRIEAIKGWVREREATFKALAKEWVEKNGGFSFGTKEYYVGAEKKEQAKDAKAVLVHMLRLTGGDEDAVVNLLSANAWKPGACRKLLIASGKPEMFEELFETTFKTDLRTKSLVKELREVDTAFLPR